MCAPAGSGKTSAAANWARNESREFAWYSLDENDNDIAVFTTYLAAAFATILPQFSAELGALLSSPAPPAAQSLQRLALRQLAELRGPSTLVIDDVHIIRDPAVVDLLTRVPRYLQTGVQLVLLSRVMPPIDIGILRGRGWLGVVNDTDLAFAVREVEDYLKLCAPAASTSSLAQDIERRTQGWAVGVMLCAAAVYEGEQQMSPELADVNHQQYISEYIASSVLADSSHSMQSLLCAAALPQRFSAELCEAMLQGEGTVDLVREMQSRRLFFRALDSEATWFCFLDLFRLSLLDYGREHFTSFLDTWHRRAAEWLYSQGMLEDAVYHAHQSDGSDCLLSILEREAGRLIGRSDIFTLLRHTRQLSEEELFSRLGILIPYTWALFFSCEWQEFRKALKQLQELHDSASLTPAASISYLLMESGFFRQKGRVDEALAASAQAMELLPQCEDPFSVSSVYLYYGVACFFKGNMEKAEQAFTRAVRAGRSLGDNNILYLTSLSMLAEACLADGRLQQARRLYESVIATPETESSPFAIMSLLYCAYGELLCYAGEYQASIAFIERAWDIVSKGEFKEVGMRVLCSGVFTSIAAGDFERAKLLLTEAEDFQLRHETAEWLQSSFEAAKISYLSVTGQHSAANREMRKQLLTLDASISAINAELNIAIILALIRTANETAARQRLELLREAMPLIGVFKIRLKVQWLDFLCAYRSGDLSSIAEILAEWEACPDMTDYAGCCASMGPELRPALQEWFTGQNSEQQRKASVAEALSYQLERLWQADSTTGDHRQQIGILSPREREVLRLIGAGLSNKEIADTLFIAESTVKSHSNSIYSKLNVKRRSQAVHRARELDIL